MSLISTLILSQSNVHGQPAVIRRNATQEARALSRNEANLRLGRGDLRLGVGESVLDHRCHQMGAEPVIFQKVRTAALTAITRARECQANLGLPGLHGIAEVLEHTRFECVRATDDSVATMEMHYRRRDRTRHTIRRYSARMAHRYHMTLSVVTAAEAASLGKAADALLPRIATEELASFLFHEALHVLPQNNRQWHNSFTPQERHDSGCISSRFEDRIYFTQAACFPRSSLGMHFYARSPQGAAYCPNVCLAALTEVDAAVAQGILQPLSVPGPEGTYGPPLLSQPLPLEAARAICSRLSQRN